MERALGVVHLWKGFPRGREGGTHDWHKGARRSQRVFLYAIPFSFWLSPDLNSVTGNLEHRFPGEFLDGWTVTANLDELDVLVRLARTAVLPTWCVVCASVLEMDFRKETAYNCRKQ